MSEDGNNGFNNLVDRTNPDLWSLLAVARDYLRNQDFLQEQRQTGAAKDFIPGRPWAEQAAKLRRVLDRWGTGFYANHLDYSYAIAVNFDFQESVQTADGTEKADEK